MGCGSSTTAVADPGAPPLSMPPKSLVSDGAVNEHRAARSPTTRCLEEDRSTAGTGIAVADFPINDHDVATDTAWYPLRPQPRAPPHAQPPAGFNPLLSPTESSAGPFAFGEESVLSGLDSSALPPSQRHQWPGKTAPQRASALSTDGSVNTDTRSCFSLTENAGPLRQDVQLPNTSSAQRDRMSLQRHRERLASDLFESELLGRVLPNGTDSGDLHSQSRVAMAPQSNTTEQTTRGALPCLSTGPIDCDSRPRSGPLSVSYSQSEASPDCLSGSAVMSSGAPPRKRYVSMKAMQGASTSGDFFTKQSKRRVSKHRSSDSLQTSAREARRAAGPLVPSRPSSLSNRGSVQCAQPATSHSDLNHGSSSHHSPASESDRHSTAQLEFEPVGPLQWPPQPRTDSGAHLDVASNSSHPPPPPLRPLGHRPRPSPLSTSALRPPSAPRAATASSDGVRGRCSDLSQSPPRGSLSPSAYRSAHSPGLSAHHEASPHTASSALSHHGGHNTSGRHSAPTTAAAMSTNGMSNGLPSGLTFLPVNGEAVSPAAQRTSHHVVTDASSGMPRSGSLNDGSVFDSPLQTQPLLPPPTTSPSQLHFLPPSPSRPAPSGHQQRHVSEGSPLRETPQEHMTPPTFSDPSTGSNRHGTTSDQNVLMSSRNPRPPLPPHTLRSPPGVSRPGLGSAGTLLDNGSFGLTPLPSPPRSPQDCIHNRTPAMAALSPKIPLWKGQGTSSSAEFGFTPTRRATSRVGLSPTFPLPFSRPPQPIPVVPFPCLPPPPQENNDGQEAVQ